MQVSKLTRVCNYHLMTGYRQLAMSKYQMTYQEAEPSKPKEPQLGKFVVTLYIHSGGIKLSRI
jgi:hypothetical protein